MISERAVATLYKCFNFKLDDYIDSITYSNGQWQGKHFKEIQENIQIKLLTHSTKNYTLCFEGINENYRR